MADENKTATPSVETPKAPPAPTGRKEKPAIPAGEIGGFVSLDAYNRAMGIEIKDEPDPGEEDGVTTFPEREIDEQLEDVAKEKAEAKKEEPEDGDPEEAENEETAEEPEKEAKDESKKEKSFKAKRADGTELDIPDDVVIVHKVDGELQEIPLKDHLNMVAGELTVNQRLGKLASYKAELEKTRDAALAQEKEFQARVSKLVELSKSESPATALCYLAELSNKSPVQMYRAILGEAAKAADAFKEMSPAEIENHFLKLEVNWKNEQQEKTSKQDREKQEVNAFLQQVDAELKEENLTHEEFSKAVNELSTKEQWTKLTRNEKKNEAIEQALFNKHNLLVGSAIDKINPELRRNDKLVKLLLQQTNPHEWAVEEIEALIKEVLGEETKRIASNLSKKGTQTAKSQKKSESKPKERKTFSSMSDMAKAFGLNH